MRLKLKSITLVALIVLTATPRVFDQLADLKDMAAARFRNELLGVFRSFTTPETGRDDARRQYSELLARAQAPAPLCDAADKSRTTTRAATNSLARWKMTSASELGHPQTFVAADFSPEHSPANVAVTARSEGLSENGEAAFRGKREDVVLVARNFMDYPLFDEFAGPVSFDDAVAQFEWRQEGNDEGEAATLPATQAASSPKTPFPGAQRLTRKFVRTNVRIRLPENLDVTVDHLITNSDALIKMRENPAPAKPKCRVPPHPGMDAPRPPEKPAIIS